MDLEKILKLVEEYATKLSSDPIAGIKLLESEFKEDPISFKAILGFIALNHKEHSDFILNYLQVGHFISKKGREKKYEDHVSHFPVLRHLLLSQLETIDLSLEFRNYSDAEKVLIKLIGEFEDFLHQVSKGIPVDTLKDEAIHTEIEAFRKKLNRLSDFVVINNQDKILKEMAALQKAMRNLENLVQKHLGENF